MNSDRRAAMSGRAAQRSLESEHENYSTPVSNSTSHRGMHSTSPIVFQELLDSTHATATLRTPLTPATPDTVEKPSFQALRMQRNENELLAIKVDEMSSRLQQVYRFDPHPCLSFSLILFVQNRLCGRGLRDSLKFGA